MEKRICLSHNSTVFTASFTANYSLFFADGKGGHVFCSQVSPLEFHTYVVRESSFRFGFGKEMGRSTPEEGNYCSSSPHKRNAKSEILSVILKGLESYIPTLMTLFFFTEIHTNSDSVIIHFYVL